MEDTNPTMEREVSPHLPTSGQVLGAVVKNMRLGHPVLRSKNAQRYFSGRQNNLVKESTRLEILEAIADSLDDLGFGRPSRSEEAKRRQPRI